MSNTSFAQLFQNLTSYPTGATKVVSVEYLQQCAQRIATHQVPVIEAKVKSLVEGTDGIVKKGQLWQPIVVARITESGEDNLVSGRHRTTAIANICANYGVSASGKVVKITTTNKAGDSFTLPTSDYLPIEPLVSVITVVVPTNEAMVKLQETFNGSRSMSPAEKVLLEAASKGKLPPAKQAKMNLVARFQDAGLFNTMQVRLNVATAIQSALAKPTNFFDRVLGEECNPFESVAAVKLEWLTAEQLEQIVNDCADFLAANEGDTDVVPSNMALNYKQFTDALMSNELILEDSDGHEYEATVLHQWGEGVKAPEKASRSTAAQQNAELQATIAALTAQLKAVTSATA